MCFRLDRVLFYRNDYLFLVFNVELKIEFSFKYWFVLFDISGFYMRN